MKTIFCSCLKYSIHVLRNESQIHFRCWTFLIKIKVDEKCRKIIRWSLTHAFSKNLIIYPINLFKWIFNKINSNSKKIIFIVLIQQQMNGDSFSENCHWFHLFPFSYLCFSCNGENIYNNIDNFSFRYWWHAYFIIKFYIEIWNIE